MARIHLIIGPVGAGKSTYALRLADERAALRLNLDEWMAALFRPDRPSAGVMEWYVERTARCVALIGALARRLIAAGSDVVLEIGLIRRKEREELYRWVEDAGIDLTVYVLDAPRDVRRARVLRRNEEQGETYYLQVGGWGGDTGTGDITWMCDTGVAPNDTCATAEDITGSPVTPYDTTTGTTASGIDPGCAVAPPVDLALLTPPSTVAALRAGYRPAMHPSAAP